MNTQGEVVNLPMNGQPIYQVMWKGSLCSPTWTQRGPALAYLDMLRRGGRKPEYSIREGGVQS